MTATAPDFIECIGSVLAVNKPGGVLTQAPPGIDSMEVRIARWLTRRPTSHPPYIGVPHRLDRPASGVMLFATDKMTARFLTRQFEDRRAEKRYWAVVEGTVRDDAGTWVDSMRKIPDQAKSELTPVDHPDAQRAVLHFRVRERMGATTWLEIQLETGRTHQVRLQAASRGHAVLGDSLYGACTHFGPPVDDDRAKWIALHARSLAIDLPSGGRRELVAPVAKWWNVLGCAGE